MKKYAVIDIGSNTVRMVVYAVEENDTFHALFSKKYTLGLAGYVQDGVMSQEGDRKSTRLNSSHITRSRMPSSA